MKPIRDFANIGIGVLFGIAVLYAKSQEAKAGLKSTVVGVGITFASYFPILAKGGQA